ncbi:MAG: amidase family protein, partial [Planctomycetota bacterium]|nr:amidase family protein [Planctomycetota bacterium]
PCMRCGTTGLRPTFGRVARTGAMSLCWSLDKIGPICRTAEDAMLVLRAINGADPGDPSSFDVPLQFDAGASVRGMRVGYSPAWFEGPGATDLDRAAMETLRGLGVEMVEIEIPQDSYGDELFMILLAEAAAAFSDLTLSNRDDELAWQAPQAWPNTFRQTWFSSAVDLIQVQRFRRRTAQAMNEVFADLDAMFGPSFTGGMLLITNNTGHPSITIRCGFRENQRPHGVTFWGNLFDEGTIVRLATALERELGVWDVRPPLD